MKIDVHNRCSDFNSYRAARVKSLVNAESGCNLDLEMGADLDGDWSIGVVVGPSGSGKTSIGKIIFGGENKIYDYHDGWDYDKPIIDCIAPGGDFNEVTGALANVGLGSVPSWLRPFHVLSNGEQFRAGLAKVICEKPKEIVIDEFTSVIDRQIAKIGSQAFQKAWRRSCKGCKVVLLTPHYDIIDWVNPDWVIETKTKQFVRRSLRRRPDIVLDIWETDSRYWKFYKPHYYLDLPEPVAAQHFIGTVDGELVCHICVCPMFQGRHYRATRLVTMPEWQGAGVGSRFLNFIGQYCLDGKARCSRKYTMVFHTSHPQLCSYLRHSHRWVQISGVLWGGEKSKSAQSISKASIKKGVKPMYGGYGGHFRAVQGFKYIGGNGAKV